MPAAVVKHRGFDSGVYLTTFAFFFLSYTFQITDIQWNPFNDGELAVGTDGGILNIWRLSPNDGPRNEIEPSVVLRMAGEKILTLRWHPLASHLLAVALSDNSIEIWDTERQERKNK